jgi:hypothetical protein
MTLVTAGMSPAKEGMPAKSRRQQNNKWATVAVTARTLATTWMLATAETTATENRRD